MPPIVVFKESDIIILTIDLVDSRIQSQYLRITGATGNDYVTTREYKIGNNRIDIDANYKFYVHRASTTLPFYAIDRFLNAVFIPIRIFF